MLFFPKFKYPKLALLFTTYILAYILFVDRKELPFRQLLIDSGYLSMFISGVFYAYGFTAAPAIAFIVILSKRLNLFAAGIVGGLGALLGDFLMFEFIRFSFKDEIEKLSKERIVLWTGTHIPAKIKRYLFLLLAAVMIASPLPDEIGVSLMAASNISPRNFTWIDYLLNTSGIFVILFFGRAI